MSESHTHKSVNVPPMSIPSRYRGAVLMVVSLGLSGLLVEPIDQLDYALGRLSRSTFAAESGFDQSRIDLDTTDT